MLEAFVYQYSVEALVFAFGIFCGVRTGVLSPKTQLGRRRLSWLILGFLLILAIQGATLLWGK